MLQIKVLGAAAGGGFPQWNDNSPAGRRARLGDPNAPRASQASIAVAKDDGPWFLINASPDLRQQIQANNCLHPCAEIRSSPIGGVVVTNGDVDAIAGLLNLRESTPFALYGPKKVLAVLDDNPIFEVLDRKIVARRQLEEDVWQELKLVDGTPSGIEVLPFRVPGKLPLYLEGGVDDLITTALDGDCLGLAIRVGEQRCFYLANCGAMPIDLAERLRAADLVFFDGTLFTDEEMIHRGVGAKTGQRMGHMSLDGPDGSMASLGSLNIRRVIFIHINNTNPILLRDSDERRQVEAAGFEVAYDGMEIQL